MHRYEYILVYPLKSNIIKARNGCDPDPCQNGGLCKTLSGMEYKYKCKCPWMYAGKHCEQLKLSRRPELEVQTRSSVPILGIYTVYFSLSYSL